MNSTRVATVTLAALFTWTAGADQAFEVVREESIFAVVTHKGGFAARLAHNHLVYPTDYTVVLSGAPDDFGTAVFKLSFPTTALAVDAPAVQAKWFPHLKRAGVLDAPFAEVSDSDRATIAEHMLGEEQLDAAAHPEIAAELRQIVEQPSKRGETVFRWTATVAFTVHAKTVARDFAANVDSTGDRVTVEAVGRFTFGEFGIEPYSAFWGAVKNKDEFDVYVHVAAVPKTAPGA